MKTFWIRTASATVYALLFLGSIYSGRLLGNSKVGIAILTGFALFVSLGCAFEYFRIAKQQDNHPNQPLGYLFTALMTVGLGLSSMYVGNALASFGVVSLLTLLVMALVALAVLLVATPSPLWSSCGATPSGLLPTYCTRCSPCSMVPYPWALCLFSTTA